MTFSAFPLNSLFWPLCCGLTSMCLDSVKWCFSSFDSFRSPRSTFLSCRVFLNDSTMQNSVWFNDSNAVQKTTSNNPICCCCCFFHSLSIQMIFQQFIYLCWQFFNCCLYAIDFQSWQMVYDFLAMKCGLFFCSLLLVTVNENEKIKNNNMNNMTQGVGDGAV